MFSKIKHKISVSEIKYKEQEILLTTLAEGKKWKSDFIHFS